MKIHFHKQKKADCIICAVTLTIDVHGDQVPFTFIRDRDSNSANRVLIQTLEEHYQQEMAARLKLQYDTGYKHGRGHRAKRK